MAIMRPRTRSADRGAGSDPPPGPLAPHLSVAAESGRRMVPASDNHRRYWRRNLRMTALLMAVWFVVTFVAAFFARELSFAFFGWPFSFWVGAQGALVVYVLIVWFYARTMDRLDREHGLAEDD
jgi:putative solute:sodium symporter small subunit